MYYKYESLYLFIGLLILQNQNACQKIQRNKKKHILVWSPPPYSTELNIEGSSYFEKARCPYSNCYITSNRSFFRNTRKFDVILFSGVKVYIDEKDFYRAFTMKRTPKQSYVFHMRESASNYPACYKKMNGFFNITWTYKLNSNLVNAYFFIRDKSGALVGPQEHMHWIKTEDMKPVDDNDNIQKIISNKYKAAAVIVSNCMSNNLRMTYIQTLISALNIYGLTVDIYGGCGVKCGTPEVQYRDCWFMIERDYYFYLSFENSFSEDYVTEKLLNPLLHYTVPIVYGSANYTRFMPDGIYLNAYQMTPTHLAFQMNDLILNKKKYSDFFKWHNHYSYHHPAESPTTNNMCRLCYMINDENFMRANPAHDNFINWWNGPARCKHTGIYQKTENFRSKMMFREDTVANRPSILDSYTVA